MTILSSLLVAAMLMDYLPIHGSAQPVTLTTENPVGHGELQVVLTGLMTDAFVARGTTHIPMAYLNLSASCESDITLRSITIKHWGQGRSSDLVAVYLGDDVQRFSRSQRFAQSSSMATLQLRARTIKKCDALRLTVFGDLSDEAGPAGEHGVTIVSPSDIDSTAARTLLKFEDASERVVASPMNAGKITVNFLPVYSTLRYGHDEILARLQLTADATSSHLLRRITLTNQENARDMDFTSLRLESRTGEQWTYSALKMDGRELRLIFSPPFILHRSSTVVFLVKGQVHASWSRRLSFSLGESGDLIAQSFNER